MLIANARQMYEVSGTWRKTDDGTGVFIVPRTDSGVRYCIRLRRSQEQWTPDGFSLLPRFDPTEGYPHKLPKLMSGQIILAIMALVAKNGLNFDEFDFQAVKVPSSSNKGPMPQKIRRVKTSFFLLDRNTSPKITRAVKSLGIDVSDLAGAKKRLAERLGPTGYKRVGETGEQEYLFRTSALRNLVNEPDSIEPVA